MNAEQLNISRLVSNSGQIEGLPANPRSIKDERFKKLVKSITDDPEMLDLRELIVYPFKDQYIVIAGNMRLKAMTELGYKTAPCKVLAPETSVEKLKRYTIKDNVPFGENDWDLLANEWEPVELEEWGVEIPGFVSKEAQEDGFEVPEEVNTDIIPGDLIEINGHRLLCGDSAKAEDVAKLMNGAKADMVFTDPPYGVSIGAKNRFLNSFQPSGRNLTDIKDDSDSPESLKEKLLPSFLNIRSVMDDACTVFVTAPQNGDLGMMMMMMLQEAGLNNSLEGNICIDFFLGSGSTMVACHQLNRKCYGIEIDPKYCQVIIDRMKKLDPTVEVKKNGVIC